MYAFVNEKNEVRHITTIKPPENVTEWIKCDEHTHIGDVYDGSKFVRVVRPVHNLQQLAHHALTRVDVTAVRCFKAGVPFPPEWQEYSLALRAIDNGTDTASTELPARPEYPPGS